MCRADEFCIFEKKAQGEWGAWNINHLVSNFAKCSPIFYCVMQCIRGTSHVPVSVRLSVSLSQVGVPHLDLVKLSDDVIRTRGTKYKLIQHHCSYDLRKFNFTNRVIPIWNSLSNHVVSADTVNCFKNV